MNEPKENCYFCGKCGRYSIATKPTEYGNCPCGGNLTAIEPQPTPEPPVNLSSGLAYIPENNDKEWAERFRELWTSLPASIEDHKMFDILVDFISKVESQAHDRGREELAQSIKEKANYANSKISRRTNGDGWIEGNDAISCVEEMRDDLLEELNHKEKK